MEKQLNSVTQLERYRTQTYTTFESHFDAYKKMFECCVQEGNIDIINDFIRFESERFILSNGYIHILSFLLEKESYFKENLEEGLAGLYMVLGHCYYFSINFEQAKKYYQIASSYALQYEKYGILSLVMNNYNLARFDELPMDVLWDISKVPPIFLKFASVDEESLFIVRFIAHIEISLSLNKVEYAQRIYNHYFSYVDVRKGARVELQIRLLQAKIDFYKQDYELAIERAHEILLISVECNSNKDLVQGCYFVITQSYKMLNKESLSKKMAQYEEHFQSKLEADKRYIEKYIKSFHEKGYEEDKRFLASIDQFENEGMRLLKDIQKDGYTLVLVDCKVDKVEKEVLDTIIHLINEEMLKEMKDSIISSTRFDTSTIGYIIQLPEQLTDTLCAKVFYKIREHYPKNNSVLEAIYFAGVNNKENGLNSYEKCSDLAYAYIYYELYK